MTDKEAMQQSWELHIEQAGAIRELLDVHAPETEGNLQMRLAQVFAQPVQPASIKQKIRTDVLDMAYINSLPQPFIGREIGGHEWPINDFEVGTGWLRIDVCGLLQIKDISDFTSFLDNAGVRHPAEGFYSDATLDERRAIAQPVQPSAKDSEVLVLREALAGAVALAQEAHAHWEADRNSKVGKILLALAGFNAKYDQKADAIHASIAQPVQREVRFGTEDQRMALLQQSVQTNENIHSCSPFCDKPACVKEQRDQMRAGFIEGGR